MKRISAIAGLLLVLLTAANAQQLAKNLNLDNKLAVGGYDPVAYFKEKRAVKGKISLTVEHDGATYRFSNQMNKDLFLSAPSSFKPQYGGWCAYAMGAEGEKVDVDPETFKIIDGKLYLFYNKFYNNTLISWNENEAKLKANADENWQKLIKP